MGLIIENKNGEETSRGQALVIDALTGLVVLLGVSTIVILATGISPLAIAQPQGEIAEQDVTKEVQTVLSASDQDGSLKETVLSWDNENERFSDGETQAIESGAYFNHPDTKFGDRLSKIEDVYGVSINVQIIPAGAGGEVEPQPLIVTTSSGSDRVVERKTITLYENDHLQSPASAHSTRSLPVNSTSADGGPITDSDTYPIEQGDSPDDNGDRYNTVTVEVVIYDV